MTAAGERHLVFAGGGTGGHIYPALAIAEEAARLDPGVRARVLCSNRAVDAEILTGEGVAHTALPAVPPGVRPGAAWRFARAWGPSVRAARAALDAAARTGPVVLVAMGGFVCPPAVVAARRAGVPVVLVNLDAVPGKANRWAARRAERVFTAAETDAGWAFVGPIVRRALTVPADPGAARASFGLDPARRTLLVTGGSQGAGTINGLMAGLLAREPGAFAGWQAVHQTGAQHDPGVLRRAYAAAGVPAWVGPYLARDDMARAWHAADLSIGRAGAGTVGEAWATRTACVFFPYPYHKDKHQALNARPLEKAGAAIVLEDLIDPDRNLEAHGAVLAGLLADPTRLAALTEPARRLGPADGAERVARALVERLGTSSPA